MTVPAPIIYRPVDPPGKPMVPEAFAEGSGGTIVPTIQPDGSITRVEIGLPAAVCGLMRGSLQIMQAVRAGNHPFVYLDRAYFVGGHANGRYRVVPNAFQHNWIDQRPPDRWEALGLELAPWKRGGRNIIVCPPSSPQTAELLGIETWLERILGGLPNVTDRPVIVRPKGTKRPLETDLLNAHCVITPTSNAAVEAVIAGVPVICGPQSAAAPMGIDDLRLVEALKHEDREPWAWSLAYGQFTMDEMKSGLAWAMVRDQINWVEPEVTAKIDVSTVKPASDAA
jgi:hypothetical protein